MFRQNTETEPRIASPLMSGGGPTIQEENATSLYLPLQYRYITVQYFNERNYTGGPATFTYKVSYTLPV